MSAATVSHGFSIFLQNVSNIWEMDSICSQSSLWKQWESALLRSMRLSKPIWLLIFFSLEYICWKFRKECESVQTSRRKCMKMVKGVKCQTSTTSVTSFLMDSRQCDFIVLVHPICGISLLLFCSSVVGKGACSLLHMIFELCSLRVSSKGGRKQCKNQSFQKEGMARLYHFLFGFVQMVCYLRNEVC